MDSNLIKSADSIGMFCRMHMKTKRNMPIRSSEMGLLIFTHKQGVPVTPLMISEFLKIAKPSVTTMVNSLVNKGYILKEASKVDGRSYFVVVSDKGKDLVESTFDEYLKTIKLLKKEMGSDPFNQFVQLIEMANHIMGEDE